MNNLQAEADWWASDGNRGIPPNNSELVEGPSPRQLFPTEILSFPTKVAPAVAAPVAPAVAPVAQAEKLKLRSTFPHIDVGLDQKKN